MRISGRAPLSVRVRARCSLRGVAPVPPLSLRAHIGALPAVVALHLTQSHVVRARARARLPCCPGGPCPGSLKSRALGIPTTCNNTRLATGVDLSFFLSFFRCIGGHWRARSLCRGAQQPQHDAATAATRRKLLLLPLTAPHHGCPAEHRPGGHTCHVRLARS
jgi:hypothetical protein